MAPPDAGDAKLSLLDIRYAYPDWPQPHAQSRARPAQPQSRPDTDQPRPQPYPGLRPDPQPQPYPGGHAFLLDVPSFSLRAGVCAALSGANGSGKTTLGKLMAGLLRPDRGRVLIDGEDTAGWPLGRFGRRVGYLFQAPERQLFAPTVAEELTFPLTLTGMPPQQAIEAASAMLDRFGLATLAEASPFTLSRGEKQRLALAALLMQDPQYLVLDEPTTGLDNRRKGILGDTVRRLVKQGAGILVIGHDTRFARDVASISFRMIEGRVLPA